MGAPAATVGVLALQGDVREHEAAFGDVGVATRRVRRPGDLEGLDGIVLPGGESTTLSMLLESSGLFEPLREEIGGGLAVFGTCAGLILLADRVVDGRPDQRSFGALDCTVRRNGYGPQRFSFEALVAPTARWVELLRRGDPAGGELVRPDDPAGGELGEPMPGVFIRAPVVTEVGSGVEVLATSGLGGEGDPVVLRSASVLAATFHPELTADRRLHRLFGSMARPRAARAR
jgi:5'-phosphate synthase pdxT subunit